MRFVFFALLLSGLLVGCTIIPKSVEPTKPSLDAGVPNSGILQALPGNNYLVTELFSEQYTNLVKLYGNKLLPVMTNPRWISSTNNNNFVITSDGINAYAQMMYFYRQNLTP